MLKKLLLIITTFALICAAFAVYLWREEPIPDRPARATQPATQHLMASGPRSTQPAVRLEERQTGFSDLTKLPPGGSGTVRVFEEETGEAKYVLKAKEFAPLTETDYKIVEPNAQVLLPGGQLAYVSADAGQMVFQRNGRRFDPKRGEFKGHVLIVLDRTTPQWRKEHPELLDWNTHPETVIKFWLDDVRFDLDLGQLFSDGPIKVESPDGTIEGRGLELHWNEVDRRITKLRIAEGKRASFQTDGLIDLGAGQAAQAAGRDQAGAATRPALAAARSNHRLETGATNSASAHRLETGATVHRRDTGSTRHTPPENRRDTGATRKDPQALTFADPEDLEDPLKPDRIDSYHIVFRDNVRAEQRTGSEVVGTLKASLLEVIVELGQKEREAVQHAPGTRPADVPQQAAGAKPARDERDPLQEGSTIVLNWTGEVLILPERTTTRPAGEPEERKTGEAERFHIVATGEPVEVNSRQQGDARCGRLEYHHESKQLWLSGSPTDPVRLKSGPDGDLFCEQVFFDQKTGLARVDGPGRLVSTRRVGEQDELPDQIRRALKPEGARQPGADDQSQTSLAWQTSARIEFGLYDAVVKDASTGVESVARKEYLKHAVFEGGVSLDQPGQSMSADHVDVTFRKPETQGAAALGAVAAERVVARGHVRMAGDGDLITCDAIDVQMTVDEAGRNVPHKGRATGHVVARQDQLEIRASDEMYVTLASIPNPLSEKEQRRLQAAARALGYAESSPQWIRMEQRLRDRRKNAIRTMTAQGQVGVTGRAGSDGSGNPVDVYGDVLDCAFDDRGQITRASILGDTEQPAHVDTGDFHIRGPRILMDMSVELVEVPGAGLLRFDTTQDLDGRTVDQPVPVVVTWGGRMRLDGQLNVGTFTDTVKVRSGHAGSGSSSLDCRDLTLRFQNLPKAPAAAADSGWILGALAQNVGRKPGDEPGIGRVNRQLRKRLAHVHAIGNASMETKAYEAGSPAAEVKGYLAQKWAEYWPDWLQQKETARPAAAASRRLVSGAYISGPQIVIDLVEENLVVQGQGNLLIRDYRAPGRSRTAVSNPARQGGSILADAAPGSLTGYSPGHTVFTWRNSMSFLNQRNIAVFDHRIEMVHQSGSQLAMSRELAAVTGLSSEQLKQIKGRHVKLSTDHLLVEFQRDPKETTGGAATLSRATRLRSFSASGRVHMQEESPDTLRSLDAAEVTYSDDTGLVRANGTSRNPAHAMVVNQRTGRMEGLPRGNKVEWNVRTGQVRIVEASVLATGR